MDFNYLYKIAHLYRIAIAEIYPEAPSKAPFGEYLWPQKREGYGNIDEKATDLENEMFKNLRAHFASKKIRLDEKSVELLVTCLKNSWYKEIFHAPPYETLYRGLYFSNKEKFKSFSGLSDNDIDEKKYIEFKKSKTFPSIDGYSTSWTYKKSISKDFSSNYNKAKSGYIATAIADVKENKYRFLAGPGGLYDVNGLSKWHLEKETIGLEPIKVFRLEWEKID